MPSLKDLKNRIDSVKSTQKITKAMQMVAAAKLRRAQECGRSGPSLCRTHGRCWRAWPAVYDGQVRMRPCCSAATVKDQVHLLVVATGERGLCRRLQLVHRRVWRAIMPTSSWRSGQDRQDPDRRAQGQRASSSASIADKIVDAISYREVKNDGLYAQASDDQPEGAGPVCAGEFDVATLFFAKFKLGDQPDPDRQADHPGQDRTDSRARARSPRACVYEYEPSEEAIVEPTCCRAISQRAGLPRHAGKQRFVLRCADVRNGQCHPQCGRNDQQAAAELQPPASGPDHQRTHRNHLGRGSALTHQRGRTNGRRRRPVAFRRSLAPSLTWCSTITCPPS
jgi:F-type H+-transporting ATPase subunit gamma